MADKSGYGENCTNIKNARPKARPGGKKLKITLPSVSS